MDHTGQERGQIVSEFTNNFHTLHTKHHCNDPKPNFSLGITNYYLFIVIQVFIELLSAYKIHPTHEYHNIIKIWKHKQDLTFYYAESIQ
jgi:hypothetical protein